MKIESNKNVIYKITQIKIHIQFFTLNQNLYNFNISLI